MKSEQEEKMELAVINKEIEKIKNRSNDELQPLFKKRQKINKKRRIRNLNQYVGRFFKFDRGRAHDLEWNSFIKIIGVVDDIYLKCLAVEKLEDREIKIGIHYLTKNGLKEEITKERFDKMINPIIKEVKK